MGGSGENIMDDRSRDTEAGGPGQEQVEEEMWWVSWVESHDAGFLWSILRNMGFISSMIDLHH